MAKNRKDSRQLPIGSSKTPPQASFDAGTRVAAVLARAAEAGLILEKGGRIAGRVSPALIERAKARTGLQSDTELVEFALANVAIDDDLPRCSEH